METDLYKKAGSEERIEILDEVNGKYNSLLEYNKDKSFAPHSKYILDIMEKRYLEQYGE